MRLIISRNWIFRIFRYLSKVKATFPFENLKCWKVESVHWSKFIRNVFSSCKEMSCSLNIPQDELGRSVKQQTVRIFLYTA